MEDIQKGELFFLPLVLICSTCSGGLRGKILERKIAVKIGKVRGRLLCQALTLIAEEAQGPMEGLRVDRRTRVKFWSGYVYQCV